jgi:hypothetical protein
MNHGTHFCRLSQAFTTHHPNVFTPILPLSEGQAGIAWVPSNKMFFFPLRYKAPLAYPQMFSLFFFGFRGLSNELSFYVSNGCWIAIPDYNVNTFVFKTQHAEE